MKLRQPILALAIILLAITWATTATAAPTAIFIVDTTNNAADENPSDNFCLTSGGKCSLRAAIQQINALGGGPHSIIFDIPGAGPHIIDRNSSYEIVSESVTIDGTTQSGAACPTTSTTGNFQIEIDATGFDFGLSFDDSAHGSIIRGLRISGANLDGIFLDEVDDITVECNVLEDNDDDGIQAFRVDNLTVGGNSSADRNVISGNGGSGVELLGSNITVRRNYIGTRNTGTLTDGNAVQGIYLSGEDVPGSVNSIEDNVVSGNGLNGIVVVKGTLLTTILGNKVGVDVNASSAEIGNGGAGIVIVPPFDDSIDGSVLIGGSGDENIIAHNGQMGVAVAEDTDGIEQDDNVSIRNNSIYNNNTLGIDLNSYYNGSTGVVRGDGVTANDDGDLDDGANQSTNFPEITGAETTGDIRLLMRGGFNHTYEIDVYSSSSCDDSGFGEGETYLGSVTKTLLGVDAATVVYSHGTPLVVGSFITAVATDITPNIIATNATSEFSECHQIVQDVFVVDNVTDVNADDASTGDGVCISNAGGCTLRAAIQQANALGGIFVQIEFDIAGFANIFLTSQLPTISVPVLLDGATSTVSRCPTSLDDIPQQLVSIVGQHSISDGIRLGTGSDGSTIRAIEVYKFGDDGIQINSDNNKVVCSIIGRQFDPNLDDGLNISGSGNVIGGGGAQARNVILGNLGQGIQINAADGELADRNVILGNFVSNSADGIRVGDNSRDTIIGGTTAGERNVITFNFGFGIETEGGGDVVITGNYIGLAPDGVTDAGNTGSGIFVNGSTDVTIGGLDDGEGNFIAGNGNHGISVDASTMTIINENTIGSDINAGAVGNDGHGIIIDNGSTNNQVAYNRIRNNALDGVRVADNGTVNNPIRFNSISDNGQQGIDLGPNGITPNDGAGDPDTGPNNLQNFPDIDSVAVDASSGDLSFAGSLDGNLGDVMRIDIYSNPSCDGTHGEGRKYLGSYDFTMTADTTLFSSTLSGTNVSSGDITMTATGPGGNTSEFSECQPLSVPTAVELRWGSVTSDVVWVQVGLMVLLLVVGTAAAFGRKRHNA